MSNSPQPAPGAPVILEGKHDGIATLVMNRPNRMNALNNELGVAMDEALGRLAADSDDELLDAAVQHAVAVHGHRDTPELRAQLRTLFKSEAKRA